VALAAGLLAFGVCTGITDIAMNARAVVVEQSAGRPIMSAFHAVFSVGTVLGSLVGAATLAAGWSMLLTAVVLGAVCGVAALAFAAFVAAMTVGRFTADWVSARVGPVAVIRYGCAAAAVGMAVCCSPVPYR